MGDEEWVSLSTAARDVGVSLSKLSRMVKDGRLQSSRDPRDERVVLVNLEEVRAMFPPRGKRR